MISVEQFRVFQLVSAKDAGVNFISISVPFHGRGVKHTGQVEVLLPRDVGQVSFGFVHSLCQAQSPKVFLNGSRKLRCNSDYAKGVEAEVKTEARSFLVSSIFYLQVVTDFHADFGHRHGHCCQLQLAHPRIQLLLGQQLLQSLQRFHMVGHDEHHSGLLMSQRHAQDGQLIGCVIIETIET